VDRKAHAPTDAHRYVQVRQKKGSIMKKIVSLSLLSLLLFVATTSSAGNKWYSGGSLHKSTVLQWKNGTQANQIATAADWALTRPAIKKKVLKSGSMDTLKPYAYNLVQCINEATKGNESNKMDTAEIAAACMVLMKW
jgi:hypothetical protein